MLKEISLFDGTEHRFLSNFHPSKIEFEDLIFDNVENGFQAAKTLDLDKRLSFRHVEPGVAKRMGRKVNIRTDWENVCNDVMLACVRSKFKIHELRQLLLSTEDALLTEGNFWHDNRWGICLCGKKCVGVGQNRLGRILMQVRKELTTGTDIEFKLVSNIMFSLEYKGKNNV